MEGWIKDAKLWVFWVGFTWGFFVLIGCYFSLILIWFWLLGFWVVFLFVFNKTLHAQHTGVREAPVPQPVRWRWQVSLPKGCPTMQWQPSVPLGRWCLPGSPRRPGFPRLPGGPVGNREHRVSDGPWTEFRRVSTTCPALWTHLMSSPLSQIPKILVRCTT